MHSGTIVATAVLAPWLLYTILKINKATHYLQLNGYFTRRYLCWVMGNLTRVMSWLDILPLLSLALLWLQPGNLVYFLWGLTYLIISIGLYNTQRQTGVKSWYIPAG